MLPTHALAGMLLALPVALLAPEFAGVAFVAGFAGGVLPDLDMYVGHRRTLHFPVYYSALAAGALAVAAALPTTVTVVVAVFLLAAAVHSASDALGGGLELRPWEGTSDRAVYDHHRGRWLTPRRWIPYDGAPTDLALSAAFAVPLLAVLDGTLRWVVVGALAVAAVYTAVRRSLPAVAAALVDGVLALPLPGFLRTRVPDRYLTGGRRPFGLDGKR